MRKTRSHGSPWFFHEPWAGRLQAGVGEVEKRGKIRAERSRTKVLRGEGRGKALFALALVFVVFVFESSSPVLPPDSIGNVWK